MKQYHLEILFKSQTIAASGEGLGAVIDTDIVFDHLGLPYIPAKRIKGCLKDAALDIEDMFKLADVQFDLDLNKTFGYEGSKAGATVYFSNLNIENYDNTKQWLSYLKQKKNKGYESILSREVILKTFTHIRRQTAVGSDGVAKKHSLRTARVIKKGVIFTGNINIDSESMSELEEKTVLNTLILACSVFRHMGTSRTRGFGEIACRIKAIDGNYLPIPEELEALCMN